MSEKKSLQEVLGEELLGQVLAKLGETKIAIVSDGSYIPKNKFDLKLDEIKGYKEELQARDEQIGQLKEAAKGNEELTNKLEQAEQANKEWAGKMVATKKEFQVKLKASALNAHDADEILAKVNLDSLDLDDNGEVKGLEEALNKIKEDKPYLFKQEQQEEPTLGGRTPLGTNQQQQQTRITPEQFKAMSYVDRMDLYNNDLELYQQLTKEG